MDILQRFQTYAAAFEETYVDDDWSRLERFFTEDASYEVQGMPAFPIHAQGRDAVFAALKGAVDGFDRKCASRTLEVLAPPSVDGRKLTVYWAAVYTLDGAEDLRIVGYEDAYFDEDGRITRLVDRYLPEDNEGLKAWLQANQSRFQD